MKDIEKSSDKLSTLESRRREFIVRKMKGLPYFYSVPLLIIAAALFFFNEAAIIFPLLFVTAILSLLLYRLIYYKNESALKNEYKEQLLAYFMSVFHPEITYRYKAEKHHAKHIVRHSGLVSCNVYNEEDVIEGDLDGTLFYLSEIDLRQQAEELNTSVFKGLLFRIKIKGANFPTSKILSKATWLQSVFQNYSKHPSHELYVKTENRVQLDSELDSLYPFILHLIEYNKDVRISLEGEEMILLMRSDMKFLDDPAIKLDQSFDQPERLSVVGKQVNSLLYIVENIASGASLLDLEEDLLQKLKKEKIRIQQGRKP